MRAAPSQAILMNVAPISCVWWNASNHSDARSNKRSGDRRILASLQPAAEREMPATTQFHERFPHPSSLSMSDQKSPETIGSLVEVRHAHIRGNCAPVFRSSAPDGLMREQALVKPLVAGV